jgi:hypothetical protein|tara:strand:+ start:11739 stop:12356 length:618 start_codon:yes stop_codon:yes gene_type:complete
MPVRSGYIHGTGAALNVEIGFVPDAVILFNPSSGSTEKVSVHIVKKVIAFTSMTAAASSGIKKGAWIKGITSKAKAQIGELILDTATTGWLICDVEQVTGTFQSENCQVYASEPGTADAADDDITVVVQVEFGVNIEAAATVTTINDGILGYAGSSSASPPEAKGFTIGSTISVNTELLGYIAFQNSPGMSQPALVDGVDQETVW